MNFMNLEIEQGTSYLLELTYIDDITGLPKNLTGYDAKLSVKSDASLPADILLSTADNTVILGGDQGTIQAYFTPSTTATQSWSQAPFDIFLTDSLSVTVKIIKGLVTILPSESA